MEFTELLSLATKESYFIFNGKLYKQVLGVANCPSEFKPHHYRWYVDDILCSFYRYKPDIILQYPENKFCAHM